MPAMGSVRRGGNRGFFLYLGLNVIVSAVTILGVLSLWGRGSTPEPTPFPTATFDPASVLASAIPTATETLVPTATPYVYRVLPDDSLFGIALKLGVSLTDLMELNDLNETSVLDVGQVLLVPTPGGPGGPPATAAGPSATASPPPVAEAPVVVIVGVSGVGELAEESVQLLNSGGVAAMAGWTLEDGEGEIYVFPEFTLHRGAVSVHTRAGQDTVIDLFWGLDQPLWRPGKMITLRDAGEAIKSTFTIPPAQ
jgi:LysM repeat protein